MVSKKEDHMQQNLYSIRKKTPNSPKSPKDMAYVCHMQANSVPSSYNVLSFDDRGT